jgi:nitrate reductase delta subunit
MNTFEAVATGYHYPTPGHLAALEDAAGQVSGSARKPFRRFVESMSNLTLAEWEELHTRTLDLSPLFAPYVGYITWGENYHRGEFLATLTRAQRDTGIETDGELADHLDPVLRYLGTATNPLPELVEVAGEAVAKMRKALKRAEPDNPYLHLLAATRRVMESGLPSLEGAT